MKKLLFLLVSLVFISSMFAFPFKSQNNKLLNYQGALERFENIEVSEPATYVGEIKQIYVEVGGFPSKSRIVLETESGKEEFYIGPMWKFFDFKPGMKVEFQAVEIKLDEKTTFNLVYKITSEGITVEIPYKKIIGERLKYLKSGIYQKKLYQNQRFQRIPMYQYGPRMPFYEMQYGYGYSQMMNPHQLPQYPNFLQRGWK
ncbi:hypothetical protein [Thermosipho melanesiensis]|uniref:Uncharacterized protein n=2 Tax=Thermosipho melanesiensis TaxID=46541 RepID=A6LLG3_THEM4|nr:hypothetical protein [Thermosipho melanesiensis]ABR30764.1 hypothetical protein Tmel_0903 [Thermosipho melanesiensis BI429]APT73887.1 hypothetical protein BW47_04845 [Thermosipho melanesiensis]